MSRLLDQLNRVKLGRYSLYLGEVKQLCLSGWKGFELYIQNPDRLMSRSPVIKGIYSAGAKYGYLLFRSGFQLVKDWYLSEGGFEGPRKLWGEKAPDQKWADIFLEKTAVQTKDYMKKENRPLSTLSKIISGQERLWFFPSRKDRPALQNGP